MKKINLDISNQGLEIISHSLVDILTSYDLEKTTSHSFIKISFASNVSIIIKMLSSLCKEGGHGVILYAYTICGEYKAYCCSYVLYTEEYLLGKLTAKKQVSTFVSALGVAAISNILKEGGDNIKKVVITHNLESAFPSKGYIKVNLPSYLTEEERIDAILTRISKIDLIDDSILVRLYLKIHPGDECDDAINATYDLQVQCNEVFYQKYYSVLTRHPFNETIESGLTCEEMLEQVESWLHDLFRYAKFAFKSNETGVVEMYECKEESKNV